MLREEIEELEHRRFRRARQHRVAVVDVLQPKARHFAAEPLNIITSKSLVSTRDSNLNRTALLASGSVYVLDRPSKGPSHINPIHHPRREDIVQIPLEVVRAAQVPQDLREHGALAFVGLDEAELGDDDVGHGGEELWDFVQEAADAGGVGPEPFRVDVGGGAGGEAV